jgi:hypothetical protein
MREHLYQQRSAMTSNIPEASPTLQEPFRIQEIVRHLAELSPPFCYAYHDAETGTASHFTIVPANVAQDPDSDTLQTLRALPLSTPVELSPSPP